MSGTWLDTQTGKIVSKQPAEGVQLASPNIDEHGPQEAQNIELAKSLGDDDERKALLEAAQPVPGPELDRNVAPTDADEAAKTVTSSTAKGKK